MLVLILYGFYISKWLPNFVPSASYNTWSVPTLITDDLRPIFLNYSRDIYAELLFVLGFWLWPGESLAKQR